MLQQCCSHGAQLQTKQLTAGRTAPSPGIAASKLHRQSTIEVATAAASRDMSSAEAAAAAAVVSGWRRPYSPGPLTEAECEQYWEQGYVIKRGLLTQDDINPCLAAIERWGCRTGLRANSPTQFDTMHATTHSCACCQIALSVCCHTSVKTAFQYASIVSCAAPCVGSLHIFRLTLPSPLIYLLDTRQAPFLFCLSP